MCGITGWINWQRNLEQQQSIVSRMTETLSLRGPDQSNTWLNQHVAFGHKRLIVVDPAGGTQPMERTHNGKQYTLVYNGELYNTEDIRTVLLKRGHRFNSHSDTEVLLTAYIEWGPDCVDHLNGIFAFAVWDQAKQQVFMARDRLGVKPLFYIEYNGSLIFGSELKALLKHPEVEPVVDREGLHEIFALGPSRTPGHGVFKGIHDLRPAHALIFSRKGLKVYRYWQVESKEHQDSLEETVEKLRSLFKDAVERQLVADVPVCTLLSGGLDSSAITAFASAYFQKHNRGPLHTYSIDYIDNDKYFKSSTYQPDPDAPFIEKVTEHLDTVHHALIINTKDLSELLKEAVFTRDLPGMADIDSSLLWFCREIKKDYTVALSGECADEIFGGYPWFHKPEVMNLPLFPWMRSTDERAELLHSELQKKLDLKGYVQQRYDESIAEVPRLLGENKIQTRRRDLFYLNMIWFMTTLLDRKDRMSMGASLEVRVPFADHRLVDYMWNVPWDMKMADNREKGLLRRALKGILPEEVLYRKKSPYPKTHHPAYTKAVANELSKILHETASPIHQLIDKQAAEEIVQSGGDNFKVPWFGQLMTGPQLIAYLIQLDTWLRTYKVKIEL
jgi:asparagine synthase (glutamine-hydrolysing)